MTACELMRCLDASRPAPAAKEKVKSRCATNAGRTAAMQAASSPGDKHAKAANGQLPALTDGDSLRGLERQADTSTHMSECLDAYERECRALRHALAERTAIEASAAAAHASICNVYKCKYDKYKRKYVEYKYLASERASAQRTDASAAAKRAAVPATPATVMTVTPTNAAEAADPDDEFDPQDQFDNEDYDEDDYAWQKTLFSFKAITGAEGPRNGMTADGFALTFLEARSWNLELAVQEYEELMTYDSFAFEQDSSDDKEQDPSDDEKQDPSDDEEQGSSDDEEQDPSDDEWLDDELQPAGARQSAEVERSATLHRLTEAALMCQYAPCSAPRPSAFLLDDGIDRRSDSDIDWDDDEPTPAESGTTSPRPSSGSGSGGGADGSAGGSRDDEPDETGGSSQGDVSSVAGTPAPIGSRVSSLVRRSRPARSEQMDPDHVRAADLACAAVASRAVAQVCAALLGAAIVQCVASTAAVADRDAVASTAAVADRDAVVETTPEWTLVGPRRRRGARGGRRAPSRRVTTWS